MPLLTKVGNALEEVDLAWVTDADNHKIYLKKIWVATGNPLDLVELYSKDTSLPVLTSFVANPSEIDEDASPPSTVTLSWASSGTVTNRRITDLHRHTNIPLQAGNSVSIARPQATTVYSLEASNTFGTVSDRITLPVFKDCVINSFTVQYIRNPLSPHNITVYYNFSVTAKPRPTISIDQGVGAISESPSHGTYNADTGVWAGRVAHTYAGPRNFTATLTASNVQAGGVAGPTVTRTAYVQVP